jgi:class 3 adenylate cyclase
MGVGATPGEVAEGIVTILFTDVEGSMALHVAKGDTQGGEVLVSDVLRQLCGASRGGLRGTWRCPGGVGLQALITQHPGRPDGPPGGEACPAGATG